MPRAVPAPTSPSSFSADGFSAPRTIPGVSRDARGLDPVSDGAPSSPPPQFPALYRQQARYVFRTLRRLGVRGAEIDDLVQEVFMVVFRRLSDYDPARPIEPWLFGIAYRLVSVRQRHRSRRIVEVASDASDLVDDAAPGPEASLADRQAREKVLLALEALDLDQRAVFVMHDIDGQPIPAVAETLDIPLNTTYSRLRAARAKFAARVRRLQLKRRGGTP
jgi:RNA polymerase sigma-70 factor (ECF subfamily)